MFTVVSIIFEKKMYFIIHLHCDILYGICCISIRKLFNDIAL